MGRALVILCGVVCLAVTVLARQATGNGDPEAAKIKNPVVSTPESIAAGQKQYQTLCAGCHGKDAKGGITISVIEDRGGKQPPDLTDDKWDHGSSDGEIYAVIWNGAPAPMSEMKPMKDTLKERDVWNVINFIRSMGPKPAAAK